MTLTLWPAPPARRMSEGSQQSTESTTVRFECDLVVVMMFWPSGASFAS